MALDRGRCPADPGLFESLLGDIQSSAQDPRPIDFVNPRINAKTANDTLQIPAVPGVPHVEVCRLGEGRHTAPASRIEEIERLLIEL